MKGSRRQGLTLIEVLIAAAILGVGLTALLTASSRCLAVMRAAKRYQDAQWALGMGELEHPVLMPKDRGDDMDPVPLWEVSPTTYDNGMVYSREVEEPDEDEKDGLYLLRSRVAWTESGHAGYEEVVRYVFVKEKASL